MNDLLIGKHNAKYDENITLVEECSVIIQRNLPSKIKDSWRFTIQCIIGKLIIGNALCDLGASINMMPLSMMKKLDYSEP